MIIGSEEIFSKVVAKEAFVLYGADYCVDCQTFKPIFEKRIKSGVKTAVYQLDTTQLPAVAQKEKIRSIPTLCYYRDGEIVDVLEEYTALGLDKFLAKYET